MNALLEQPLRYFGIYLATMLGIEAAHQTLWTLLYLLLLMIVTWLARRHTTQPRWSRLAAICASLAIGMNVSYQAMAAAVPAVRFTRYDATLMDIDRWLFGATPAEYAQHWVTPWLTDIMSFCYLLFMPLLLFNLLRYFFYRRELLGAFYTGLFTVYGLGFLGYLLVPAAGPWLAYPDLFPVELTGGAITALNHMMVVQGSNKVDVWPSLHCAVSLFILGFAWRHHRRQFWFLLAPVCGLWLSTFYLRYHYFIDVMCGFALAAFALYESGRHANTRFVEQTGETSYVTDH